MNSVRDTQTTPSHKQVLASHTLLRAKNRTLDLSRPKIMGILNVTPDSFSDGGSFCTIDSALKQAELMLKAGASIIDIGGESTRPGADLVTEAQELDRVIPVVEAIAQRLDVMISVDTSNIEVIRESVQHGAHMWNDIRALSNEHALTTAANLQVAVCLMHMQGTPQTMHLNPYYDDVFTEVTDFLLKKANECIKAGIQADSIILDPGFGFGKRLEDNYTLLAKLKEFTAKLKPYFVLSALSRKKMIGNVTQQEIASDRVSGSVAGALISVMHGAHLVRVHDVKETAEALAVYNTMLDYA